MENEARILCVDDDLDICSFIEEELREAGFLVKTACSGEEAWQILTQEKFDAVVTDLKMPNGDGYFLLGKIRQNDAFHPHVYIFTGYSDTPAWEAYARGANGIFYKPIAYSGLIASLTATLKGLVTEEVLLRADPSDYIISDPVSLNQIGRGGFFFEIAKGTVPEVGRTVFFSISVPNHAGQFIKGRGICKWSRAEVRGGLKVGTGIEITSIASESFGIYQSVFLDRTKPAYIPET